MLIVDDAKAKMMNFHADEKIYHDWTIMTDAVRLIEFSFVSIKSKRFFLVWDIWDKDRQPPRATLKHGSIYDYYDILEEIGR